jgi:hypothetical protein
VAARGRKFREASLTPATTGMKGGGYSPLRGAFSVDRAGAREVPTPFLEEFRRGGDVAAYAGAYTGFLRAVTEPVVRAALGRPEGEDGIVECLYGRIRDRLLADRSATPGATPWWPPCCRAAE